MAMGMVLTRCLILAMESLILGVATLAIVNSWRVSFYHNDLANHFLIRVGFSSTSGFRMKTGIFCSYSDVDNIATYLWLHLPGHLRRVEWSCED